VSAFDPSTWLFLTLLGGWVAADSTGAGQIMVSRPLVAATLAGWVAGSPEAGLLVGVVLEAFHLTVLPVGAARYPEGGPPAVVAGGVFAVSDQHPGTLLAVVLFFLVWELVSGASVRGLRQVNSRLMHAGDVGIDSEVELERRHLLAVVLDFGRGLVLVLLGLILLLLFLSVLSQVARPDAGASSVAVRFALIAMIAGAFRLFGGRTRFFAAGAAAGLLFVLVRG
jgi:mannose/fructose/N-acetylgalactosamine-specific phosphotransferase system component IIC